eukprot:TRINITY_DN22931_c0_g1_i1.p1 TRINITY_DN22931_c0_g1~~TRINITY_DN22931_c0_g1_i1.p1  ORF type:complete len:638 (+),score=116.66 TRINITY_DN22931_c0_g1_i1:63-1976(+)
MVVINRRRSSLLHAIAKWDSCVEQGCELEHTTQIERRMREEASGEHLPEDEQDEFTQVAVNYMFDMSCQACSKHLSSRGLQIELVASESIRMYSTDIEPNNIVYGGASKPLPGQCPCRLRDFSCSCGAPLGYAIIEACAVCSQCSKDDHPWLIIARSVVVQPRKNSVGETMHWPSIGCDSERGCLAVFPYVENVRPCVGEPQAFARPSVQDDILGVRMNPLSDINGRDRFSGKHGLHVQKDDLKDESAELFRRAREVTEREDHVARREEELYQKEIEHRTRERTQREIEDAMELESEQLRLQKADIDYREAALDERERALREREDEVQAQSQAHAGKDASSARARRAEDVALSHASEVESLRSTADSLRALVTARETEARTAKEELARLRAALNKAELDTSQEQSRAKIAQERADELERLLAQSEMEKKNAKHDAEAARASIKAASAIPHAAPAPVATSSSSSHSMAASATARALQEWQEDLEARERALEEKEAIMCARLAGNASEPPCIKSYVPEGPHLPCSQVGCQVKAGLAPAPAPQHPARAVPPPPPPQQVAPVSGGVPGVFSGFRRRFGLGGSQCSGCGYPAQPEPSAWCTPEGYYQVPPNFAFRLLPKNYTREEGFLDWARRTSGCGRRYR